MVVKSGICPISQGGCLSVPTLLPMKGKITVKQKCVQSLPVSKGVTGELETNLLEGHEVMGKEVMA